MKVKKIREGKIGRLDGDDNNDNNSNDGDDGNYDDNDDNNDDDNYNFYLLRHVFKQFINNEEMQLLSMMLVLALLLIFVFLIVIQSRILNKVFVRNSTSVCCSGYVWKTKKQEKIRTS